MNSIIFILFFNVFSLNTEASNDKVFKIDDTIFVLESMFLPGAGHMYNDHYKSAFLSFTTTFSFLMSSTNGDHDDFNKSHYGYDKDGDFVFHSSERAYDYYNDRNRYTQKKVKSNTYLMLFLFSYFE